MRALRRLLLPALALLVPVACLGPSGRHVTRTFLRVDTVVTITLAVTDTAGIGRTWQSVDSLLTDWEKRFSLHTPGSELPALNARTGAQVAVSPELGAMVATGLAYGDTTAGLFDITVSPLKRLWGLASDDTVHRIPAPAELAAALTAVGYRAVGYEPADRMMTFHNPDAEIDIGGIAKGFVLRHLYALLTAAPRTGVLIEAGGDIMASGTRADGRPWVIGVRHPRDPGALLASFPLYGGTVVTSGDYERFWMRDGVRYHHIFDPRTGHSARLNRSVTVYAPDPVEADILSTALFCLPADSIMTFVETRPRLECIIVDSAGTVSVSGGWKHAVALTP